MRTQILGIDISDGHIAGVVLAPQRRAPVLIDWCCLPMPEGSDVAASILQLGERLAWDGRNSLCGLPLSLLSVRNLSLPFADAGKIAQALPFELEEQLPTPLESVVYDYCRCLSEAGDTQLVVFALDRSWLARLLEGIQERMDPDRVLPAMVPLAGQAARSVQDGASFLLVHADLQSTSIALVMGGSPILYRRLSHPEEMIVHPPFVVEDGRVVADSPAAEACVALMARLIGQSLDFFFMDNRNGAAPERVVLAGPLAGMDDALVAIMSASLHLPVERLPLLEVSGVVCTEEQLSRWNSAQMDRALAVALAGKERGTIDFRRHDLAKTTGLLSSRRQWLVAGAAIGCLLLAWIGYLGIDTSLLQQRDKALQQEMVALFRATFPEVTRIQDPFIEMQVKLKALQGTETPIPSFLSRPWVLPVLADISRRIPASLTMQVTRLSLERQGVMIKGITDAFNGVESIKTALSGSPRLRAVRIVSATADKGKKDGTVRFELQMQLDEGP